MHIADPASRAGKADRWPTTQRFSRRCGDSLRGAEYASAIERPCQPAASGRTVVVTLVVAIFGALAIVLGQTE